MDQLQVGDPNQVGPLQLLGRLGEGGMGQVFLGVSPGGRKVAVKIVHPTDAVIGSLPCISPEQLDGRDTAQHRGIRP